MTVLLYQYPVGTRDGDTRSCQPTEVITEGQSVRLPCGGSGLQARLRRMLWTAERLGALYAGTEGYREP